MQLEANTLAAIRSELDRYKTAASSLPAPVPTNPQALDAVLDAYRICWMKMARITAGQTMRT